MYIGLTPFLYLHNTAGSEKLQDGMFHKNGRKKLEKLRMDRIKQVWYDIYIGRLPWGSRPVSFGGGEDLW